MDEERSKVQGHWQCAGCEKEVTELPFQPREGQEIYCRDCYASKRPKRSFGGQGQKQMVQGEWECSGCKKVITELPFRPSGNGPIFCRDCYRSKR